MNLGRNCFLSNDGWEGYLESGKTFGFRDKWREGSPMDVAYKAGWDLGMVEHGDGDLLDLRQAIDAGVATLAHNRCPDGWRRDVDFGTLLAHVAPGVSLYDEVQASRPCIFPSYVTSLEKRVRDLEGWSEIACQQALSEQLARKRTAKRMRALRAEVLEARKYIAFVDAAYLRLVK